VSIPLKLGSDFTLLHFWEAFSIDKERDSFLKMRPVSQIKSKL